LLSNHKQWLLPRVELRFGREGLLSMACAACSAPLGPYVARAVVVDEAGYAVGGLCAMCLSAPGDELGDHFQEAADDFLALAASFQTMADRARRRTLLRPTLAEWLAANQRAERDLLDS
jgi:hypothetical protein